MIINEISYVKRKLNILLISIEHMVAFLNRFLYLNQTRDLYVLSCPLLNQTYFQTGKKTQEVGCFHVYVNRLKIWFEEEDDYELQIVMIKKGGKSLQCSVCSFDFSMMLYSNRRTYCWMFDFTFFANSLNMLMIVRLRKNRNAAKQRSA